MPTTTSNYLALDVGERRIGVALATEPARLAHPLTVVTNNPEVNKEIKKIVESERVAIIVIGLPRNLHGEDTEQTKYSRDFADKLGKELSVKIVHQDEALTSRQAEAELRERGGKYEKGDIDALAATYILQDYLANIKSVEKAS
jgi:putative holliday junction resolvase